MRSVSICYYVLGGLIMLFSCLFIIHIVIGLLLANSNGTFVPTTQPGQFAAQPPTWAGYLFAIAGTVGICLGWSMGLLTIYSGRCISRQQRRTFSLVIAGILCAWFPFGTTLGVFSFIVLLRDSVRLSYETR